MGQLSLGPTAIIFEMPVDKQYRHLNPLYLEGYINGKPVNRMMVDTGASVNILPYAVCRKIGRTEEDLIKTNVVLNNFKGNPTPAKGVLNVDLTIGHKTVSTLFVVIDSNDTTRPCLAEIGSIPTAASRPLCISASSCGTVMK